MIWGLVCAVTVPAVICLVDKLLFSSKYKTKAEAYLEEALPPLEEKKRKLENGLNAIVDSDRYYNYKLLLPEKYSDYNTILELISLLQSRRALTLADAINAYEDEMHRKKIENMEQQKVLAAQAAAAAQN